MASTWDRIPQTHRAILFEQFTDGRDNTKGDLYNILSLYDDPDMSSEEMYRDISTKLEVRSFREFLEKFQPKVYEFVTGTTDGVPTFNYTTDPQEAKRNNAREIAITSTYYEMLANMYSQKGDSGVANIDFNDAKLREILTPKREFEALCDTRRRIPMLMEKREAALKRHENTATFDKKLNRIMREAVDQLNNPVVLISIDLDDIGRKIEATDQKLLQLNAPIIDGGDAPKLIIGRPGFDDDGRWILIPPKPSTPDSGEDTDSPSDPDGDNVNKFANKLALYVDKKAPDENEFTKALIVSAYTGRDLTNPFENMDAAALTEYRGKLVAEKAKLENGFKQAKEEFIRVLSESVQKLLCVKIFFDHATVKGGDNGRLPKVGLIVANCTADKLVDDKVKKKFESTMRHLGLTELKENKLWFAILPHVLDELDDEEEDVDDFDDEDLFGSDNADAQQKPVKSGTSFSAAKTILRIMDECKIMTVFNFAPTPKTTFSALNAETVNELQETLEPLNFEHAVYALPNFTIMREGTVPLGDGTQEISVPAMYIDAAYVAAGLLIAAQQPDYWTSHGFTAGKELLPENACVRIDFESDRITPALLTKFNRESSSEWDASLVQALTKNRFGFVFDGDERYSERIGSSLPRTYILNARTLKRENGEYKTIFRTLMNDFVNTWLKFYSKVLTLTGSQVNDFRRAVEEWKTQRKKYKSTDPINLLLRENEDIIVDGDEVKIVFADGEERMTIKIVDTTKEATK